MGTDESPQPCESSNKRQKAVVTVIQRADTSELAISRLAQIIGRQIAREEFKAQQGPTPPTTDSKINH